MLSLQSHHIINLYVMVDDLLPATKKPLGGRPLILSDNEAITILLWNVLVLKQKTLKDIYKFVKLYHTKDFPILPQYNTFVMQCHRIISKMAFLLELCLQKQKTIRFMDSTMIEVCKLVRAHSHKVAKSIARFGKNHQGYHYGFKLHASIDSTGKFCGLAFTPADVYDAHMMPEILGSQTKIAVGDGGYSARLMREKMWNEYGTIIISPPHYKQKKKLSTWWQDMLLKARPKIESVFDYLKEHLHLVSSFPRSINGFLLHYIRIILGYQLSSLLGF